MSDTERPAFNGIIRPFRQEDLPSLRVISEHWLQDDGIIAQDEVEGDMNTLRASLEEDSGKSMFVAQTPEGQVVGMMGLSDPPKSVLLEYAQTQTPAELIVAYVHPDFTRIHGTGTALLDAVQDLARTKGKEEIMLESGPRHIETGHPFYDKHGFTRVGIIKDYYGEGADTVVWRKPLI